MGKQKYTVSDTQLRQMIRRAVEEATHKSFILMVAIPNMIIHDKFDELLDPEGREEKFANYVLDLYDTYEKGYVTLEELAECLKEEAGIDMIRRTKC